MRYSSWMLMAVFLGKCVLNPAKYEIKCLCANKQN